MTLRVCRLLSLAGLWLLWLLSHPESAIQRKQQGQHQQVHIHPSIDSTLSLSASPIFPTVYKFTEKDLPESAHFGEDGMHFNLDDESFVKDRATSEFGPPFDPCH